jgi:hypothetical protein
MTFQNIKEKFAYIRRLIQEIREPFVVIYSLATPDGGRAGVLGYVAREIAARLIANERARLATDGEIADYFAEDERRRQAYEDEIQASRMHIAVVKEARRRLTRKPGKGEAE